MRDEGAMIYLEILETTDIWYPKGINPSLDSGCFELKKCCKKYKKGNRCKKCPKR